MCFCLATFHTKALLGSTLCNVSASKNCFMYYCQMQCRGYNGRVGFIPLLRDLISIGDWNIYENYVVSRLNSFGGIHSIVDHSMNLVDWDYLSACFKTGALILWYKWALT